MIQENGRINPKKLARTNYFALNLRYLIKNSPWNGKTLGAELGKSGSTVSSWTNEGSEPNFDILIRLGEIFDVNLDDMLRRDLSVKGEGHKVRSEKKEWKSRLDELEQEMHELRDRIALYGKTPRN